jgi:hypothetical protein
MVLCRLFMLRMPIGKIPCSLLPSRTLYHQQCKNEMLIQYTSQQFGNELNNKNKREEAFAYGEQEIFDSAGCNGNAGSFTIVFL